MAIWSAEIKELERLNVLLSVISLNWNNLPFIEGDTFIEIKDIYRESGIISAYEFIKLAFKDNTQASPPNPKSILDDRFNSKPESKFNSFYKEPYNFLK